MEFIAWDQSMSVGVPTLDKDHMRLLELFNDVLSSGIANRYTEHPVSREELKQEQGGFPDLAAHRDAHRYFIDEIARQRAEFEESDAVMLRIDLILLLKEWLLEHIQGADKKYSPFMAGASGEP